MTIGDHQHQVEWTLSPLRIFTEIHQARMRLLWDQTLTYLRTHWITVHAHIMTVSIRVLKSEANLRGQYTSGKPAHCIRGSCTGERQMPLQGRFTNQRQTNGIGIIEAVAADTTTKKMRAISSRVKQTAPCHASIVMHG